MRDLGQIIICPRWAVRPYSTDRDGGTHPCYELPPILRGAFARDVLDDVDLIVVSPGMGYGLLPMGASFP